LLATDVVIGTSIVGDGVVSFGGGGSNK